jgi:hypothetical protein
MAEQREHWAIERKIPIAMLTALAIQTGVWIWQAAAASARLDQLEKKVEAMVPQGERIVRVETKTDLMIAALAEVRDILRQRLRNYAWGSVAFSGR